MKKKTLYSLLVASLLLLTIFYPSGYKIYLNDLIELILFFFLPALFPSVFLIMLLLDTGILKDLKARNKSLAGLLLTLIFSFGGTPILMTIIGDLKIDDKTREKILIRHIGPSFSFIFFLLSPSIGISNSLVLASLVFVYPLFAHIISPLEVEFIDETPGDYNFINSLQNSGQKTILSLGRLFLMIAVLGIFNTVFTLLPVQDDILLFLQGLLEYTSGSLKLIKDVSSFSSCVALGFVIFFNGLSSYFNIKKTCQNVDLKRVIIFKLVIALTLGLIFGFLLFKASYYAFRN